MRAYGYAGVICAGPMLLGVMLLLGARYITGYAGASGHDRELLNSMLTYALLFSLTLTSLFSMATTRAIADLYYLKQLDRIMPTFYGSLGIMLPVGVLAYGIFLYFSGVSLVFQVLSLLFFAVLIVVWTEINYLTAIKNYREILTTFFISLLCALLLGALLSLRFNMEPIKAMFISIITGYGVMMIRYFVVIYRYFPQGKGTCMHFLRWFDNYPQLTVIGFFITAGLFGHLVIMWGSRIGIQVQGLFYGAPSYDIPALVAFLSILITTVNFVTSVEVRFYPCYRDYFSLFNDKGSLEDIEDAERNMLVVLREELIYLAQKQVFTTILFIILGTLLLPLTGLGFTREMLGIFRVLCIGYAFYAIGNSIMLIQLYFADHRNALLSAVFFMACSVVPTFVFRNMSTALYGFGFLIGGAVYFLVAMIKLNAYISKIKYHVLSRQPVFKMESKGLFSPLCDKLEERCKRTDREKYVYSFYSGYEL